jgi:amidase
VELVHRPATELAQLIATGEVSVSEIFAATLRVAVVADDGVARPGSDTAAVITRAADALQTAGAIRVAGGACDLTLSPVYPTAAPSHGVALDRTSYLTAYAGRPAATVRCGTSSFGLPIAVQVAAEPGRDDLALAAALVLESALGGYQPPSDDVPVLSRRRRSEPSTFRPQPEYRLESRFSWRR